MEIRVLITTAFLLAAVAVTLLGIGGAAGNGAGLIFWLLLAAAGVLAALSLKREHSDEIAKASRRTTDHESR
ncbi:hypothetical protein ACO2I3_07075 [Leptospira interrogans]